MRASHRLDRLEAAMSPLEAVCYWLDERAAFDSMVDYGAWVAEQPQGACDHDRALDRAHEGARIASRGLPIARIAAAQHEAGRDVLVRMELVHGLDSAALETIGSANDRLAALSWQLRALSAEWSLVLRDGSDDEVAAAAARWRAWLAGMVELIVTLDVEQAAREALEQRCLGGRTTLFASTHAALDRLRMGLAQLGSCWTAIVGPMLDRSGRAPLDDAVPHGSGRARLDEAVRRAVDARMTRLCDRAWAEARHIHETAERARPGS